MRKIIKRQALATAGALIVIAIMAAAQWMDAENARAHSHHRINEVK